MSIHEECGVFGVISPRPADVGRLAYYGLYALQHRGQESCGIVVNDDGVFASHKDLGLVGEVFSGEILDRFPQGTMAVGHTRYGTTGASNRSNCQPIEVNHQKGRMALAHNGNLSNAAPLRDELELSGAIFHSTSDTEIIAYIVTKERLRTPSIEDALSAAMDRLEGAYSLVLMSPPETDLRPGPPRLPPPVLREKVGRDLCGRLGELRADGGGGGVRPGPGAGRDSGVLQRWYCLPPGTLRQGGTCPLHL